MREKQVERLEAQNRELTRTLRLSEEARAVLADQYDFAPVGFVTLDAKGCVREINLTAARMVGRKRAPLLGMPFFTHIARPHLPAFLHHLRECRAGSGEVISEAALQAGGGALPVELRSVPVLDPRRGDTVYRTTIIDITARLRTSQALRQSEERYRELVELSPDGIFITSAGTIVFANRAALRLCGVEQAEALFGGEFIVWAHPAYRAALSALLLRPFTDHETPPVEARFAREDGTTVDVEVVARPLRRADERPAALVVARDITRRKTAERHVLKISERERAGFGRDLHDSLCQSLMGAAFLTDALRKDLKDAQPRAAAAAEKVARVVRSCGEEARNLARGLCPVTMEQHGLVAALHELAGEVAARMKVDCALQCEDHLAIQDTSRATHLYRIAQEAISNAIRHGRAKSVLIQLTANNGKMALRIEDNGKGIAAKPKKSGMGLHTMHYRASLIGGSLDVERLLPRGTAVTCTFSNHSGNR